MDSSRKCPKRPKQITWPRRFGVFLTPTAHAKATFQPFQTRRCQGHFPPTKPRARKRDGWPSGRRWSWPPTCAPPFRQQVPELLQNRSGELPSFRCGLESTSSGTSARANCSQHTRTVHCRGDCPAVVRCSVFITEGAPPGASPGSPQVLEGPLRNQSDWLLKPPRLLQLNSLPRVSKDAGRSMLEAGHQSGPGTARALPCPRQNQLGCGAFPHSSC